MAELELEVISTADNRGLVQAARDTDKLRGATDQLGREFDDTTRDTKELDTRIATLRQSVRALGAEFAKTQGPSVRKDLGSQRSVLREMERIAKELNDDGSFVEFGERAGGKAGQGFVSNFTDQLGSLPSRMRGALIAGAVGALIGFSPVIGAAIAGAVSGAVGVGGIAGGIAAASKDPRVRAEAKRFGRSISSEFFSAGDAFIEPTIKALRILEKAFQDLDLGDAFAKVAPFVDDLAMGIGDLGRNFMPGFNKALERAGPFLVVLGRELGDLGTVLGDFLDDVSASEGALEGFHFTLNLIQGTIMAVGHILKWLSDRFHDLLVFGEKVTGGLAKAFAMLPPPLNENAKAMQFLNDAFKEWLNSAEGAPDVEHAIERVGDAISDAEFEARKLSDVLNFMFGDPLDLDQALLDYKEGFLELRDALLETKGAFDENTLAGLRNRSSFLDRLEQLEGIRQKQILLTGDTKKANDQYQIEYDKLRLLASQAGITGKRFDDLAGQYNINFLVSILVPAVAGIANRVADLFRRAFSFQSGGETPAFAPFKVHDGEMLWSNKQHYVSTKAQSERLAGMGGSGGRGRGASTAATAAASVHFSGDVDSAFASAFMRLVRAGKITVSSGALN